ncbi:MAG: hypothetical protein ABFD49_10435 [Armatimonadota bacterium]|nr:hypothetical protein [bacterium]
MNELMQWIIAGIAILAATRFLVRRMTKSAKGDCRACCKCKSADGHTDSDCAACKTPDCNA